MVDLGVLPEGLNQHGQRHQRPGVVVGSSSAVTRTGRALARVPLDAGEAQRDHRCDERPRHTRRRRLGRSRPASTAAATSSATTTRASSSRTPWSVPSCRRAERSCRSPGCRRSSTVRSPREPGARRSSGRTPSATRVRSPAGRSRQRRRDAVARAVDAPHPNGTVGAFLKLPDAIGAKGGRAERPCPGRRPPPAAPGIRAMLWTLAPYRAEGRDRHQAGRRVERRQAGQRRNAPRRDPQLEALRPHDRRSPRP